MGEYLVHARLGCWISINTLPWHIVAQLVSAQNETLSWLAEMNYVKCENMNPLQSLTFDGLEW